MNRLRLDKPLVPAFLDRLRGDYRVIGPRLVGEGDIVYEEIPPGATVAWNFTNSLLPPKALFFPRVEELFTLDYGDPRGPTLVPAAPERPLAVFGMRSCDATGLLFLERFFGERGFDDPTVTSRVRDSLRMTLACTVPGPDCFCVCCDAGPFLTAGFDLQFVDLGERLLVEVGSERGLTVARRAGDLLVDAGPEELRELDELAAQVDGRFQRRSYLSRGTKLLSLDRLPAEAWESWGAECQGCGGCCFVCPTCSCFTVRDIPLPKNAAGCSGQGQYSVRRERIWDACLYEGFTREASGHNPREQAGDRLKRRFFHKLSLQCSEIMGRHGCVGCGRCVQTCMGALDISTLMERTDAYD